MREEILEAAAAAETPEGKACALRECIQAATLRSLHESGAFESLCLTGDAALRFACGSPDYATDLEFRLVDKRNYRPEQWLFTARRRLRFMGLDARIAFARRGAIHSGWVKVSGLLVEPGAAATELEPVGFKIVIETTMTEDSGCKVALAEAAGECFALRYCIPPE